MHSFSFHVCDHICQVFTSSRWYVGIPSIHSISLHPCHLKLLKTIVVDTNCENFVNVPQKLWRKQLRTILSSFVNNGQTVTISITLEKVITNCCGSILIYDNEMLIRHHGIIQNISTQLFASAILNDAILWRRRLRLFGSQSNHIENKRIFNSLWQSDAMWWQGCRSTLVQVMACSLTAPSHYLNQCWLIITKVQWCSSEGYSLEISQPLITKINLRIVFLIFYWNFSGANELKSQACLLMT